MKKSTRITIKIEVSDWESSYSYKPALSIEDKLEREFEFGELKTYGLSLIRDAKTKFVSEIEDYIGKELDKQEQEEQE